MDIIEISRKTDVEQVDDKPTFFFSRGEGEAVHLKKPVRRLFATQVVKDFPNGDSPSSGFSMGKLDLILSKSNWVSGFWDGQFSDLDEVVFFFRIWRNSADSCSALHKHP